MIGRSYLAAVCAVAAIGCASPDEPITLAGGTIVVDNRTNREWRNVVVTVNHHYAGGVRTLASGGRLHAPLSQFATGHGQRFDRNREVITNIVVTATDAAGEPVRLEWSGNRNRTSTAGVSPARGTKGNHEAELGIRNHLSLLSGHPRHRRQPSAHRPARGAGTG